MKIYFDNNNDDARTIENWREIMEVEGTIEMELFLAKIEHNTGYFYCKEYQDVGELGNCGITCEGYKANNGKNGRCKHYGYCYECTDEKFLLNINKKNLKRIK